MNYVNFWVDVWIDIYLHLWQIGGAYGLASMMSIAISIVLMRYLQNVHHSLINLILGWWGSLQTITLAVIAGVLTVPQGMDIISDNGGFLLMTASGLLFFFGQTSLAVALQLEEAGPVSLVRTSEVVFAFIWQIVFLNVFPDIFRWVLFCEVAYTIFNNLRVGVFKNVNFVW